MGDWKNILDEDILKTNINFAAIFVLNYECPKDFIISKIRGFYSEKILFKNGKMVYKESQQYKEEVRQLDENIENASLKWFMQQGAITQENCEMYDKIRKRRNDIVHELLKNLGNGFSEYDNELFNKMVSIYTKMDRWWINEIEIPTSAEKIPNDYDRDDVYGGEQLILSIINSVILENKGDEYKKILKKIWKSVEMWAENTDIDLNWDEK